jgi:hypothetical protein
MHYIGQRRGLSIEDFVGQVLMCWGFVPEIVSLWYTILCVPILVRVRKLKSAKALLLRHQELILKKNKTSGTSP